MKQQLSYAITFASALAVGSTLAIADDKAGASANAGAVATGGETAHWDRVDVNKDGYVSQEEAKNGKIATDFALSDTNADGRLSKDEFAALQASGGAAGPAGPASEREAEKAVK